MGRHVNQPSVEKQAAKRDDHRRNFPADHQEGIYQADQQRQERRDDEGHWDADITALQPYKGNSHDSVNGTDREINFLNEIHERLSDRLETQDRGVLANVADGAPIEPLLGIPQAEQSKYKNAADDDPEIWTSNESPHEGLRRSEKFPGKLAGGEKYYREGRTQ